MICYVPIVPLGSFRVIDTGDSSGPLYYRWRSLNVQRVPLDIPMVVKTYALAFIVAGILLALIFNESGHR